ncbi:succinate-semialdehyde dehydrogenase [Paraburkholderia sp. GAS199]|uniref:aldehyde dehydrogenase family protein n=1 Tax=Paraburkholderia sp. GAS199 TaxID=3035126 RepID=UPI003D20F3B9
MSNAPSDRAVSRNPATGEVAAEFDFQSNFDLDQALSRSFAGFKKWRELPLAQRAKVLKELATVLRDRIESIATVITREMGKPIAQAREEVEKCAFLCDWYSEHGPGFLKPKPVHVDNGQARHEFRPLGPVLAVMPWNFPAWQVLRGAVGILLVGNSYVLKPAPNVVGSAYMLLDAFAATELPAGVFEVVNIKPEDVSRAIIDPRVAAIAVTASAKAGAAIASQAGAALKKCVLELGGADPYIVLADADLDEAVKAAVVGRFQNTGQVCIAAKRIIVEQAIAEEFERRFVAAVKTLTVGDPMDERNYVGPMARYDLRDELDRQVQNTLDEGAHLLLGGRKMDGPGNFYEPTILAGVQPGMTSFAEELFGPVASITVARDVEHSVELANTSEFGLSGTIWTRDLDLADRIAEQLEAGSVFVNGYVATDPRLSVGGVKKSGYGRELSSFGLLEFTNIQSVWIGRH